MPIPRTCKGYGGNRIWRRYDIAQLFSAGIEERVIAWYMSCSVRTVVRWEVCAMQGEMFVDKARCGRPPIFNDTVSAQVISWYTQTKPLDISGMWTLRWAEAYLRENKQAVGRQVSKSSLHRILQSHRLKPHLLKYFLHITDPDFFPKMEHIVSVYLRKLKYLFCFDECPGIQVLQRHTPRISSEARGIVLDESHYNRHGTIDVLAFLQVSTGQVVSHTTSNHEGVTFRMIFELHVKAQPADEQLHYIMDNLSTHCNDTFCELVARLCNVEYRKLETVAQRCAWLQREDKRIVIHFTPYHGSWLNMVEIWFSILKNKCLDNPYSSPQIMSDAINRFTVEEWNKYLAHEFKWKYTGEGLHEKVVARIIDFFKNHHTELTVKFMTKQMLLIVNMARNYWDRVSIECWKTLAEVIELRKEYFQKSIDEEKKPRIRTKAEKALDELFISLMQWPIIKMKNVA